MHTLEDPIGDVTIGIEVKMVVDGWSEWVHQDRRHNK